MMHLSSRHLRYQVQRSVGHLIPVLADQGIVDKIAVHCPARDEITAHSTGRGQPLTGLCLNHRVHWTEGSTSQVCV